MHVLNAWLPPPVAENVHLETQAFSQAVRLLERNCSPYQLSSSPYSSLKWISVFNNFLKSKSDLAICDVELFIKSVLNLFLHGEENFYLQARWGSVLCKFLKKFSKKISLIVDWKPLYDAFLRSIFTRRNSFEGLGLQSVHVPGLSNIIRKCRRFFPKGSAAEIWAEFRPMLEDLSHNTSLEAAGFLSLLLPTNSQAESDFYTSEWFADCLELWDGVPYCQYWNAQWASLVRRVICNSAAMPNLHVEQFVPILFSNFLRSFEVPVAKSSRVFPYQWKVDREIVLAFSSDWSHSLPKNIAKSIVYLLKPNGSTEKQLGCMVDLLEQYYHPSNGGPWTSSLEHFLRHIVTFFLKRLAKEDRKISNALETGIDHAYLLTSKERKTFVETILRLIERGIFSKHSALANTAANSSAGLAYIEPALVLPLSVTSFHTALDSITATHQLEVAVKTLALSARTLLIGCANNLEWSSTYKSNEIVMNCKSALEMALFDLLSGLDANDPPKTRATFQFFCSVFSSLEKIETDAESSSLLRVDWSQWLDGFLGHLFTLLSHLESTNHVLGAVENNQQSPANSFLVEGGSFYFSALEVMFSRLNEALYEQALKKVAKFVQNNTLTGAVTEVGLLCSAVVCARPQQGIRDLMRPVLSSVLLSLNDCPPTGFSGIPNSHAVFDLKTTLSPALEASIVYQLNLSSLGLIYGGEDVVQCRDLLLKIIAASFDAPSAKVNEAGSHLLSAIIGSAILYYPLDQYRVYGKYVGLEGIEEWLSTKSNSGSDKIKGPTWHIPNVYETSFANEILDLHLKDALTDLKSICSHKKSKASNMPAGSLAQEKEHLRVILLRIDGSLRGVQSCLPDFRSPQSENLDKKTVQPYFISGAVGASVGSADLRETAAETLHLACNYFLEKWADDNVLLLLLAHNLAVVGNFGSLEYSEWTSVRDTNRIELASLVEPSTNYMTSHHVKGPRRPKWLVIELVLLHNTWRASQSQYNCYRAAEGGNNESPYCIRLLSEDLTKLSLHNYNDVRKVALSSLRKVFKRFPNSIKESMPILLSSLQDSLAPEHAVLGSCTLLGSRSLARYRTEDFDALSSFLLAVLNSAHHGSMKAQNAINELFATFIMRFGGLPREDRQHEAASVNSRSYADTVTKVQSFCSNGFLTHWRYNLMAQGMLLLLSAKGNNTSFCQGNHDAIHDGIKGHFLSNLKSDFPPLRSMSISSLLFLLQSSGKEMEHSADLQNGLRPEESAASSSKHILESIMSQENFGSIVFQNVSVDHQFSDSLTQSRRGIAKLVSPFDDSGISLLWVRGNIRSWPRTRTLDSTLRGDGFSSKYAKLFEHLIHKCDSVALEAFCGPLKSASSELAEKGIQCAAAEVIAGFLHSDRECIFKAWDEWLQLLLKKFLSNSSVESITEWAACIRFSVTGKGRLGRQPPLTRPLVLGCLLEPAPPTASSNALLKRFTFLCAALTEIPPSKETLDELVFHRQVLMEALKFARHSAPQVREVVGMAMCIAGANLEASNLPKDLTEVAVPSSKTTTLEDKLDWKVFVRTETFSEALKCQRDTAYKNEANGSMENVMKVSKNESGDDLQDAVRFTETVLYFLISTMKSGRSMALISVIIELLEPVLSLQETAHKDLSSLAKVAFQFLKFQLFPAAHISKAVSALLAAANDNNWHTSVASLSLLQSFIYRHIFLLPMDCWDRIWSAVKSLLSNGQLEVRELAAVTLSGMMKGSPEHLSKEFYENQLELAAGYLIQAKSKRGKKVSGTTSTDVHALVLGLSACVQSVPYDMPSWLPKAITTLARFSKEASPAVRATVRKCVAEFRRTHADTWAIQKSVFSEEELEILTDTSSSASFFA